MSEYIVRHIDAGHRYSLPSLDGYHKQELRFVKRYDPADPSRFPGNHEAYPGTTLQAVMRALIARVDYLQKQIPCFHNRAVRLLLCAAIWCLEVRAARRHGRAYWHGLEYASRSRMCPRCGHTGCNHCV